MYPPEAGLLSADVILALDFDHMYTSPVFLGLLALLAASLSACTATRQWPTLKVSRKWQFKRNRAQIAALTYAESLPRARLGDLAAALEKEGFRALALEGKLYAFRGLTGRVAPIVVHAAMLFSMMGFLVGAVGGWEGSANVSQ